MSDALPNPAVDSHNVTDLSLPRHGTDAPVAAPGCAPGDAAGNAPGHSPSDASGDMPSDAAGDAVALEDIGVARLVQEIHAGRIQADSLSAELRRQCVGHLTIEGCATSDIAALMRVPERTIRRDRAMVRREEAVGPSLTLGDELLGEYQRFTLASVQRLTRMCNAAEEPAYARLWAEEAISRV